MWELIRANKRKSIILLFGMGAGLALLGYVIGLAFLGPNGGMIGISIALALWIVLSLISFLSGDSILLAVSKAKRVSHDVHPQLFNVVEEMKIASNFPHMPKVYIINDPAPNAFATGRNPKNCAIVVTAGLLSRLNRDELQGVVAHEMSHIVNRDIVFMTLAGILLGSIVLISNVLLRGLWYSSYSRSSRRYTSSRGGGQAQIILIVVAIAFAILSPIIARLLYLAISRKREYLADASAVRLTRYPEGLASALEKISSSTVNLSTANKVTAPMYIVNPLKPKKMSLSNLSSTHPPIQERVRILRGMTHGVNYSEYQKAFSGIRGSRTVIIPPSGLRESKDVPIRQASLEKGVKQTKKQSARDIGDLMRAVNNYAFLVCVCGLKMKLPPNFKKSQIGCPRCKREVKVPIVELATMAAATGVISVAADKKQSPYEYLRKGKGWETFTCACGKSLNLSPVFSASHIRCNNCGTRIRIISGN